MKNSNRRNNSRTIYIGVDLPKTIPLTVSVLSLPGLVIVSIQTCIFQSFILSCSFAAAVEFTNSEAYDQASSAYSRTQPGCP